MKLPEAEGTLRCTVCSEVVKHASNASNHFKINPCSVHVLLSIDFSQHESWSLQYVLHSIVCVCVYVHVVYIFVLYWCFTFTEHQYSKKYRTDSTEGETFSTVSNWNTWYHLPLLIIHTQVLLHLVSPAHAMGFQKLQARERILTRRNKKHAWAVLFYAPDCALNLWVLASLTKWIMNIWYEHIHWAGSVGPLSKWTVKAVPSVQAQVFTGQCYGQHKLCSLWTSETESGAKVHAWLVLKLLQVFHNCLSVCFFACFHTQGVPTYLPVSHHFCSHITEPIFQGHCWKWHAMPAVFPGLPHIQFWSLAVCKNVGRRPGKFHHMTCSMADVMDSRCNSKFTFLSTATEEVRDPKQVSEERYT